MGNSNNRLRFTPAEQAILTTLLYSDIFSFPLTKDELWRFLIVKEKITPKAFKEGLQSLAKVIVYKDGYYCLQGKEASIIERKQNLSEVAKKLRQAYLVATKLTSIPSIGFIGISGGLANGSATKNDDIDFVVIVKKNTLFTSRLLILGMLERLGVRRSRGQKEAPDSICVNLLLDERSLTWQKKKQDLYTAREIAQIFPLFERDGLYERFFIANRWIYTFLPNSTQPKPRIVQAEKNFLIKLFYVLLSNAVCEYLFRIIQMSFMKRHQTREVITKHILAFHPNDYRTFVLRKLRLKMRQFGLLTKL